MVEGWTRLSLSRLLGKTVSRHLQDKEHRREFEKWYFEKYGKNYEWRKERILSDPQATNAVQTAQVV